MAIPLLLDPAIRDWVLMPILIVMILVGILRDKASHASPATLQLRIA
jgi:hypothetical protein